MTTSKNQDSGAKKIIDQLVQKKQLVDNRILLPVDSADPDEWPDRYMHRVMCGCAQCLKKNEEQYRSK